MANKPTAELHDWYFDEDVDWPRLCGIVRNHFARPDLSDGTSIYTSRLKRVDFEANIAETQNTIYTLKDRRWP